MAKLAELKKIESNIETPSTFVDYKGDDLYKHF
jgi:hypothetical protein